MSLSSSKVDLTVALRNGLTTQCASLPPYLLKYVCYVNIFRAALLCTIATATTTELKILYIDVQEKYYLINGTCMFKENLGDDGK